MKFYAQPTGDRVFKRSRKPERRAFRGLEWLESRVLLTVDLTGTFTTFPSGSVVSGTAHTIAVGVENLGTTAASGTLVMEIYATPDGTAFDPNDPATMDLAHISTPLAIGPGGTQTVNVLQSISAAIPAGNYELYAVIDPQNKIIETNDNNNLATSSLLTVTQPNYDLTVGFGATNIPSPAIAGTTTGSAQLIITNGPSTTTTIPAGVAVAVQVVARPVGVMNVFQDVVLNKAAVNVSVASLAPGGTRSATVAIVYPADMPAGAYNIIAEVDTGNALAETSENNNEITLGSTVTVVSPLVDFALTMDSGTTPPATTVLSDGIRKIPLKVDVQNLGNVVSPTGLKGTFTVVAERISDDQEFTLGTFSGNIGALGVAKFRTLTLSPALTLGLPTGSYNLEVSLNSGISSDVLSNNTASTADTGLSPLAVTQGIADLSATITGDTLPPALVQGLGKAGSVTVSMSNLGNVALPTPQHVKVTVALRPAGNLSSSGDIVIGTLNNQAVGGMAINGKRSFVVPTTVLPDTAGGNYVLVATVTPVETLAESNLINNTASSNSLTITSPFVDFGILAAAENFPPSAVGGSAGQATFRIENFGNIASTASIGIQVRASATGDINDSVFLGGKTIIVNLAPGGVTPLESVPITLPANIASTSYTLFIEISPSAPDTNPGNNVATAGLVTSAPPFIDLHFGTATEPFNSSALAGAVGQGVVTVQNLGNSSFTSSATITYYASVSGSIDGTAVMIGSKKVSLSLAPGATSNPISVNLTMPTPVANTDYKIIAVVTSNGPMDVVPDNNVSDVLSIVSLSHFGSVFPAALGDTLTFTTGSSRTAGGTTTQTGSFVTNLGVHGTYTMVVNGTIAFANSLSLQFSGVTTPYTSNPQFNDASFLFGGHTITFSLDSTGDEGHAILNGKSAFFSG